MRIRRLNVRHDVASLSDDRRVMLDCSREDLAELGSLLYRVRKHLEWAVKAEGEKRREIIELEFIEKSEWYRAAFLRALRDLS